MLTLWLTRVAAAVGGLALSFAAGAGIASADPDLGPMVNTTCNYGQLTRALKAVSPEDAELFNASPEAQDWLRSFLATRRADRKQMAQEPLENVPALQEYIGDFTQVANTCKNY